MEFFTQISATRTMNAIPTNPIFITILPPSLILSCRNPRHALGLCGLDVQLQPLNLPHPYCFPRCNIFVCNCAPRLAMDADHSFNSTLESVGSDSLLAQHLFRSSRLFPFA